MAKMLTKAMLAMALLAGCGNVGLRGMGEEEAKAPVTENTGDTVGTRGDALTVDLRMRGIGAEDYAKLVLAPGRIQIRADGVLVPVEPMGDLVDLADMGHAHLMARFQVPAGTRMVAFSVELGAAGGFETTKDSGWVDTRAAKLEFVSEFANLAEKNKAVIEVNAAKSLVVRDATTRRFVPKFNVQY